METNEWSLVGLLSMETKFGDYLFILNRTSVGHILTIATLDRVSIIEIKLSSKALMELKDMVEMVALGVESQFMNLPMSDPNYRHVLYIYRNPFDSENMYIMIYKQYLFGEKDKLVLKTHTHVDSGEVDCLFDMLSKLY